MLRSSGIKELFDTMFDSKQYLAKVEELPFRLGKKSFCRYEPIEKRIDHAKVLIVNSLLRYKSDLSALAREEWRESIASRLAFERKVSSLACDNIAHNINRLVKQPKVMTVHLSEVAQAASDFRPDAIVMSGTYSDFDYYNPEHLTGFSQFIKATKLPLLAICGSHQLVALSFGSELRTLDDRKLSERRTDRIIEYQYRFVKIVDRSDPIFDGIDDAASCTWQDYAKEAGILRVWQNHGVQVIGVPAKFKLLATSYLCKNQMMVKNSDGQLIYTVQFHLEKSFEDWAKNPTFWEHPNESRDGRILFENFLKLALRHK
ncbi:MAG: hypothetical protein C4324_03745 [Blastocatellia bacterium]